MKKFFAFAMAIVSMAAVMTSCNNNDAEFIEQKAPVAPAPVAQAPAPVQPKEDKAIEFDGNIYFCAYPEQMEAMNVEYEVSTMGGNVATIKVERLQVANQYPAELTKQFVKNDRMGKSNNEPFVEPTVYVYNIPSDITGEISITPKFTVKKDSKINGAFNAVCGVSATNYNEVEFYDATTEKIEQFLNVVNGLNFNLEGHK